MLKKAGIIVAGSAVALLAASPLAFATPSVSHSSSCSFYASNHSRSGQSAYGLSYLLGAAAPNTTAPGVTASNTSSSSNTQTQSPMDSCNNVSNVMNTTSTTTDINKSRTKSVDISKTYNSNNSFLPPLAPPPPPPPAGP